MTEDDNLPVAEPRSTSLVRQAAPRRSDMLAMLGRAVTLALDTLDAAGDVVAERLGIRPR